MADKIAESLATQRSQLTNLLAQKAELETQLATVTEGISNIRGSIVALEYVQTLNLVEKEQPKS